MIFDLGAAELYDEWIKASCKIPDRPMTDDEQFYIQWVGDNEYVLVPKDCPLMTMSDEEFAKSFDNPFYDRLAEILYATNYFTAENSGS